MKKIAICLFAMTGLLFTSCDMGVKDSTAKEPYPVFNLVTPLDGGAPVTCGSYYEADMNLSKLTATLNTTLVLDNKSQLSFTTNEVTMKQYPVANYFGGFTGYVNGQMSMPIEDASLLLTYNFNNPYGYFVDSANKDNQFRLDEKYNFYPNKEGQLTGGTAVTGVLYLPNSTQSIPPVALGGYRIGNDYRVDTFTTDCTYQGTTHTSYEGTSTSSTTIFYRVILDIKDNKAYVVIYKGKFSTNPSEPEKPIIYLAGLDIEWGSSTYTVKGENIVPKIVLDNQLQDFPAFIFTEFTMRPVSKYNMLTESVINYKVRNAAKDEIYNGSFQGSFAYLPQNFVP